jgi:indole-3-glycerol phosphate synthase
MGRLSVDQHGASATSTLTAAIFAAGQIQVIAQYIQQCDIRVCCDLVLDAVYI